MSNQTIARAVLFTAFEPSGDAHAAPVIRRLRELMPDVAIYAWGGPKMQEAGATLLDETVAGAAMGLNGIRRAWKVRGWVRDIKRWSRQYRVLAHVAVDSPAANWPICKTLRSQGSRVIHLVAPQLWAWGGWRIGKLRRNTDHVLCLLPFEQTWFRERNVRATFVGHPRMGRELDEADLAERVAALPHGAPRVAMLPGSRAHEVAANVRAMANIFTELKGRHGGMTGIIAAATPELAEIVQAKVPVFPTGLHMVVQSADSAIAWADLCIAVSGTVTLDITRQAKPMIGMYRTSFFSALLAKFILRTPYRLLPNVAAGREIVPEFVPYAGSSAKIVDAASYLLADSKRLAQQSAALEQLARLFEGRDAAELSAQAIVELIEGEAGSNKATRPAS